MKRIAVLMTSLALLIPGAAIASASSTSSSYGQSQVKNVSASRTTTSTTISSTSPAVASASTGTLPFTGLDLVALAAGGAVLLGAGVVLRRVSAPDRT